MSIVYLLSWWYGSGWLRQWEMIGNRIVAVGRFFSVATVISTLFSPWKQLISHSPGFGINIQKLTDNLISRFVGFFIRIFTIFAAMISFCAVVTISVAIAVVWPLLPVLSVVAIIKGLGLL